MEIIKCANNMLNNKGLGHCNNLNNITKNEIIMVEKAGRQARLQTLDIHEEETDAEKIKTHWEIEDHGFQGIYLDVENPAYQATDDKTG